MAGQPGRLRSIASPVQLLATAQMLSMPSSGSFHIDPT